MKIPTKKLESGFELPVYGLGLWEMGGRWESDHSKDGKEIEAIQAAIEAGVTHIDTAESYANGHAEELLAEAKKGYDRSKLFIATKVSGGNQSYDDLHRSFAASLKRLDTDYVDLYILHRFPSSGIDYKGTMKALDELVKRGAVKHIGASNMTPHRFETLQNLTKNKLVCNQVHYNVQYREIEDKGVLKHAQKNDIMIVAWRPVQKGMLPKAPILTELAKKYGKTETQIAINWIISQENVVTIAKTSTKEHLKENLGALDWSLAKEDVERIRREFPDQRLTSDAVPLDYTADVPA